MRTINKFKILKIFFCVNTYEYIEIFCVNTYEYVYNKNK